MRGLSHVNFGMVDGIANLIAHFLWRYIYICLLLLLLLLCQYQSAQRVPELWHRCSIIISGCTVDVKTLK